MKFPFHPLRTYEHLLPITSYRLTIHDSYREVRDAFSTQARSSNLHGLLKPFSDEFQDYLDRSSS